MSCMQPSGPAFTRSVADQTSFLKSAAGAIDRTESAAGSVSTRNIEGVRFVAANRISARDVMDATRVIATREALERLQDALG